MTYINVAMAQEQEMEMGAINPAGPDFGKNARVRELNDLEAHQALEASAGRGQSNGREQTADKILENSPLKDATLMDMDM